MVETNIVISTVHAWNIERYKGWMPPNGFRKHPISSQKNLTSENLEKIQPRYVFFPHWPWLIPKNVYENFECVVFHMTDLPFGRGGSPLQNLIVRGIYETKISAIRVIGEVDAGPVYLKEPFSLKRGRAQDLYAGATDIVFEMIETILLNNLEPHPQKGKVVIFNRRKPEESRIPHSLSGQKLYDFIRMLDADGYPRAFVEEGNRIFYYENAVLNDNGSVSANVIVWGCNGESK